MSPTPLVSVILPVYNNEHYLAESIESVLAQTYPSIEIICVDDGSTDNTRNVMHSYGTKITLLFHEHNRGIAAGRNTGIREAKGAYIAFMDGDDIWDIDKIEKQIALLETTPSVDIAFCMMHHFFSPNLPEASRNQRHLPEPMPGVVSAASCMRRALFDTVGTLNEALTVGEFVDWLSRAQGIGVQYDVVTNTVLHRRIHETNTGITQRHARPDYIKIVREALERKRRLSNDHV
jgi:glycosyltransferase involved in cell wall biosynthesis